MFQPHSFATGLFAAEGISSLISSSKSNHIFLSNSNTTFLNSRTQNSLVKTESEHSAKLVHDNSTKARNEKRNQLVAHLEKERLKVGGKTGEEANGQENSDGTRTDEPKNVFRWRLDQEILKSLETGKSKIDTTCWRDAMFAI
jgi:hypothetical protein